MKKKLYSAAHIGKIILYVYVLYRLLNMLVIWAAALNTADAAAPLCPDFEYPASQINKAIDYDKLGQCHKFIIDKDEFETPKNYKNIIRKLDVSFLLFPWSMNIDLLSPDNEQYCHQYTDDGYDISVWCGVNAFNGNGEIMFFYYNDMIILFPLLSIVFFTALVHDIIKLIRSKNN